MSVFKKVKTIVKSGLEPIEEGMKNYNANDPKIELLALKRYQDAKRCKNLINEPIHLFKVKDERIKGLSEKMCDGCGCSAPYLFRQNIKKCECWEK